MGIRKYNYTEDEKMILETLLFINLHKKSKLEMMLDRIHRGMSLTDIAVKYGVSKSYVHEVEMKILTSIRTALENSFRRRLAEYNRIKQVK